jgi:hypothetical protein
MSVQSNAVSGRYSLNHSGHYDTGYHQPAETTDSPPTLGSESEVGRGAKDPTDYRGADHNPNKQNRPRAA